MNLPFMPAEHELFLQDFYTVSPYLLSPSQLNLGKSRRGKTAETFLVDFGSSVTKAGNIVLDASPILVCPSETFRAKRNNQDISVSGNKVLVDNHRASAKKVFDDFANFDARLFEDFCDYVFSEVEVSRGDRLVFCEPLGVVRRFRETCFELFFECYELSEVMPVVDSVAASYGLWKKHSSPNSIVVSIGASKTTILPFVNSNLDARGVRRLGCGMETIKSYFTRLLAVKYPAFYQMMGPRTAQQLFEREGFCAFDYKTQMRLYKTCEYELATPKLSDFRNVDEEVLANLRPPVSLAPRQSQDDLRRLEQERSERALRRQEASSKMAAVLRERREERQRQMTEELNQLESIAEPGKRPSIKSDLDNLGFRNEDEFKERVKFLRKKLGRELNLEPGERFKLLEVPDEELSPRSLRLKKFQFMHKQNQDRRLEKKAAKEQKQMEIERQKAENPCAYLSSLKEKRAGLKARIKRIKVFNEDSRLRKQKESQRIESLDNYLEGKREKFSSEFETVFKELMDVSSDCDKYEQELETVNQEIKELEPNFDEDADNDELYLLNKYSSETKIFCGADLARSAELIFRPYICGSEQKGLFESLKDVLENYDDKIKANLLKNVFIIGGGANFSGIAKRLSRELWIHFSKLGVVPVDIHVHEKPLFAAYQGAQMFYKEFEGNLSDWTYTKREYQEHGINLFKGCPIGNL